MLEFDNPEGELLDFLLVDVGEVLDMGGVELLDGLGEFGVDVDEFLEGFLEGEILLIEIAVLLAEIIEVTGEVVVILFEEGAGHGHTLLLLRFIMIKYTDISCTQILFRTMVCLSIS